MKKVFTLMLAVALMLSLLPATAALAQVGGIASIEKAFDVESAGLCEHVTGAIVVETLAAGVVVTDEIPEGLALYDVSISPSTYSELIWDEDGLSVTLDDADEYTISFDVQVTDVLSYDSTVVTNEATATDAAGNVDSASDDLELLPYGDENFGKYYIRAYLEDNTEVDRYAVPVGTKVFFLMYVDGKNILSVDMIDAYIKDNLGGDLMLEVWETWTVGSVTVKHTGKTEKAHMTWEIGDVLSDESFMSNLIVSTDENTGTGNDKKAGHQEYTDEGCTTHYLNSGATLKFTDSDTGFTCSVSSAPIEVMTACPD